MTETTIILEGKVREFAKSEAGNLAFMLEDSQGNLYYCFSPIKRAALGISDDVVIHGTSYSGNKIRLNYIFNKTRNTEDILIEARQDWTYKLSLVFSIIVTVIWVFSLLILIGIIPINFFGMFDAILGFVFSLIMVILLLPVLIIMWVLTSSFGKKRRESDELSQHIAKMKQNIGISEPIKPILPQVEPVIQSEEAIISGTAKFCAHCGNKLPKEAKFCSKCGAKW
jgi:ABC-type multidrug transport system fused ATPase/permease subunit